MNLTQRKFNEFADDVGLSTACDIARAMGVEPRTLAYWVDDVIARNMGELRPARVTDCRVSAAGMVH